MMTTMGLYGGVFFLFVSTLFFGVSMIPAVNNQDFCMKASIGWAIAAALFFLVAK